MTTISTKVAGGPKQQINACGGRLFLALFPAPSIRNGDVILQPVSDVVDEGVREKTTTDHCHRDRFMHEDGDVHETDPRDAETNLS